MINSRLMKKKSRQGAGLLLTILLFAFLYLPIIIIFIISINNSTRGYRFEGLTLKWYSELLFNFTTPSSDLVIFREAIFNTIWVALRSTIIATVLGTIFAIGINALDKKRRVRMMVLNNIPVVNPDIVTGISLMVVFTLISFSLGETTVLIAHVFFSIPYVVLSVVPKLKRLDPNMYEAALDLGCSRLCAIWKVIIPNISTGIIGGALIAFTMSIDDFVISYFTSGIDFENVSIWLYTKMKNPQNLNPTLYAYNVLIILITIGVILFISLKKDRKEKQK
jgi:spermidine/putrescine transport system permease protein